MDANYAEICRVGNLQADFQRSACTFFPPEIFTILLWNINNSFSAKKHEN